MASQLYARGYNLILVSRNYTSLEDVRNEFYHEQSVPVESVRPSPKDRRRPAPDDDTDRGLSPTSTDVDDESSSSRAPPRVYPQNIEIVAADFSDPMAPFQVLRELKILGVENKVSPIAHSPPPALHLSFLRPCCITGRYSGCQCRQRSLRHRSPHCVGRDPRSIRSQCGIDRVSHSIDDAAYDLTTPGIESHIGPTERYPSHSQRTPSPWRDWRWTYRRREFHCRGRSRRRHRGLCRREILLNDLCIGKEICARVMFGSFFSLTLNFMRHVQSIRRELLSEGIMVTVAQPGPLSGTHFLTKMRSSMAHVPAAFSLPFLYVSLC